MSKQIILRNDKAKGVSGTLIMSGIIDDEYLAELQGQAGQQKFLRMESDAKVRQVITAVNNPIKSAQWTIQSASEEEQDLKVKNLIEHILFKDIKFYQKLEEIITYVWRGFALFEKVHINKTDDTFGAYTTLEQLGFRNQETIDKWNFVGGKLVSVHQKQSGDIAVDADIPVENLILFFNERKGDDKGFPFLRMMYGNYKRKLLYKTYQAIGIERSGLGTPILTVPKEIKKDSEQYADAEQQLTEFTQAENAFFMLPEGWALNLSQNNTFDPEKIQTAIKAENEEMSGSLVGMFLEMGIGGNAGNMAGTETSARFFKDGLVFIANKICEIINNDLIPDLVRLNYGDSIKVYPTLHQSGITDEVGEVLMRIVTGYANAGIVTKDETLEDHVRKAHNLPKKEAGEKATEVKKETIKTKPEVELSNKKDIVVSLIDSSSLQIQEIIKEEVKLSGTKFIHDTMNRYRQLSDSKTQKATSNVTISRSKDLKKKLEAALGRIATDAIVQAKKEIPNKSNIELRLSNYDKKRCEEFGIDSNIIELNNKNKNLPAYVQTLISSQADLITEHTLEEMKARMAFTFSSTTLKSKDENIIKQKLEDTLDDFIESNNVEVKGDDVVSLVVNEGRNSFFFDDDVIGEIHSFTYMNESPVSLICNELTGLTVLANDYASLMFSPPNHHRCKSYLRANLYSSAGIENLEITKWSPTAKARKGMTL